MSIVRLISSIFLFLSITCLINAQGVTPEQPKTYIAKIKLESHRRLKGILVDVIDSAVVIKNEIYNTLIKFDTVSYDKIENIRVTRKNKGLIGMGVGAAACVITGLIAISLKDDVPGSSRSQNNSEILATTVLLAPAAGIGFLIGDNSGKFAQIDYSYEKFRFWREARKK